MIDAGRAMYYNRILERKMIPPYPAVCPTKSRIEMRKWALTLAAACSLLATSFVMAATYRVPADYGNLDAAAAQARHQDTILVADNTYTGDANLLVQLRDSVTVMSENGYARCIIDGENTQGMRAFIMSSGSKVIGFTITRMTSNVILDSSVNNFTIRDCFFTQNLNVAANQAVAIKVYQSTGGKISHCIFQQNDAGTAGGVIAVTSGSRLKVWNCIFDRNTTRKTGGAVFTNGNAAASFTDIGNCLFISNSAGNGTSGDGGAVAFTQSASGAVHNCTFVTNSAPNGMGGGVYKGSNSNFSVTDCIFWENTAVFGYQLAQQDSGLGAGGRITINNCIVQAPNDDAYRGNWRGENIITEPPQFTDGRQPLWGIGGLYLEGGSPAIDAGHARADVDSIGMDTMFVKVDLSPDTGVVDIGFHYDYNSYLRLGTLYGNVQNASDGLGMPFVTVATSRRMETWTDADGNFRIEGHPVGHFRVGFTYEGFLDTVVTDVSLQENDSVEVNVVMLHAEFTPSVQNARFNVFENDSGRTNFVVSNAGSAATTFRARAHLTGANDREPWEARESFRWGATADDNQLRGFVYVDSIFYVSGSNIVNGAGNDMQNLIYKFDRQGTLLDSFAQACYSNNGFDQLTYDGRLIWGVSADTMIYGFDEFGNVQSAWRCPNPPYKNIAWDPENNLFWISSLTSDIVAFDRDGNNAGRTIRSNLRKYGLFYWKDDPDHHPLYAIARPTGNLNRIYKIDPARADTVYLTSVTPDADLPCVSLCIAKWDLFSVVMMSIAKVSVADGRDRGHIWQLSGNTSWMMLDPTDGAIPPGTDQQFSLGVDMDGFPRGRYAGRLVFNHNALNGEWELPIDVNVTVNDVSEPTPATPTTMELKEAYPNPFNGMTSFSYSLPKASRVTLTIHDLAGREVARLVDGERAAGSYPVSLDASKWASSVYIAKLAAGGEVKTMKLVLMK